MDLGNDLTWQCIASGLPSVEYSWYRNAEPLIIDDLLESQRERFSISNNVLTINNVSPEDEAMYQCGAENIHAIHFSTAQLRVLCK